MSALDDAPTATVDVERLTSWLDDQGLGQGGRLEHRYVSGGSQNEIYELHRGDLHCALRIPPPTAPASFVSSVERNGDTA